MADLGISGLASGFDWKSFVEQMTDIQRAPQKRLLFEQNQITQRNNALTSIKTAISTFSSRVDALKDASLFETRSTTSSSEGVATVSSTGGSPLGSFSLNVIQLASVAKQKGAANVGAPIASSADVTGVVLGSAGFSTAIKAGTFTVNGQQIEIATTDTLQEVFNKISDATNGEVIGNYDPDTDKIVLSGDTTIVLGSATDTSNFLQVTKLNNNGTANVESGGSLGGVQKTKTLGEANFTTAIDDGGAGAGEFKINGVSISFSTTGDSVQNVIDRINKSGAGVNASYDNVNDRFVLTSKTTGDQGISLEDVTGNFLAATGITTGALERGKNLIYEIDGGGQLTSASNTITEDSSGLTGLSIKALGEGTTEITVSSDTTNIRKAITDFVDEYNTLQKLIDKNTASTTDAAGKVTAGLLAQDNDTVEIAKSLRSIVVTRLTTALGIRSLDDIGIITNGNDDTLEIDDESKLDTALGNNLTAVTNLFTDTTEGLAAKLAAFIEKTTGDDGTLITHQSNLTDEISGIDKQIEELERFVQTQKESLTNKFVAMETAQAQINQQLSYLQKNLQGLSTK
jgi:flagellar hook-associated protein 2